MKVVIPSIGVAAVIIQLIRLWPLGFSSLLPAFVTGGVFYIACKVGWDMQKNRILQDGYKGWGNWFKRAIIGISVFLTLSLTLLFYSFHNPICEETGDPFYGRCEKHSTDTIGSKTGTSFNMAVKVFYPLLLALAFVAGSGAKRIEYMKEKGKHDRNV